MTPEIITAIASGIAVILGVFIGFNKWLVNKFLSELKPNGGKSLKDQINRLEERFERLEHRVDDILHLLAQSNSRKKTK